MTDSPTADVTVGDLLAALDHLEADLALGGGMVASVPHDRGGREAVERAPSAGWLKYEVSQRLKTIGGASSWRLSAEDEERVKQGLRGVRELVRRFVVAPARDAELAAWQRRRGIEPVAADVRPPWTEAWEPGMVRLGLTGGIASGKSLVATELAALGADIIDADVLAREVVAPGTPGLGRVVDRFGDGILTADGSLDRAALGELVFNDEAARQQLNALIHPMVRSAAMDQEAALAVDAVVVHAIPLLVETGQSRSFDAVIVVDVPEAVQLERLQSRDGLSREQALARIRAQASREQRLAAATWVIDNSGDVEATRAQVRALWDGPIAALRAEEAERRRAALSAQPDPDQLSDSPHGGQEHTRLRSP